MKRLLLASIATGALALAAPAWAQSPDPAPATPPITQPEMQPEVTPDEQIGTAGVQEAPLAAPEAGEEDMAAEQPAPNGELAAQPMDQPAPGGEATAIAPASAAAAAVCQPRVTSVHFGQRGSALTLENRNALEYAVDAASVCNLEQVTITDSAEGRTSDRRTETVRAALIERGVPEDSIVVAETPAEEGAATGQLDVRMTFAGVATSGTPSAALEAAPAEPAG
jgi:outer membrane protein OmpA-like peptidoglycan-associated protein